MPAPKTPQQEAEELKQQKAREQAERQKRGGHQNEDGPSESSRIGEHSIDPENRDTTKKP